MDIIAQVANELNIDSKQVEATVELLDAGSTIPFIARYRKETTNNLEDQIIRQVDERVQYLRKLVSRQETIVKSISDQGKLTPALENSIMACLSLNELEDLYRPYKPKRKTRGTMAIQKGLKPLAEYISHDRSGQLESEAKKYISVENKIDDCSQAIQGASDILAEEIADNANYRIFIKNLIKSQGYIATKLVTNPPRNVYNNYQDFREPVNKAKPWRILAINRGVKEKCLTREIVYNTEAVLTHIATFEKPQKTPYGEIYDRLIADSFNRLIKPSVENDVLSELFEGAEDSSIETFKVNLKQLLMQAPLKYATVLGFDPGYRNGCKIAVIDQKGDVLTTGKVFNAIHKGDKLKHDADIVSNLLNDYKVKYIALGNGTASRESEKFLRDILKDFPETNLVIVSEAGASVYSASKIAIDEFPDYDVALRSAVSIARRLLDPLSELVKIEPEAIGVGQYQHDMNQNKLKSALTGVVEDCVNAVGVDINIASFSLLTYIAGINKTLAKNIVKYRSLHGKFTSRDEFKKVKQFGAKAFLNAAGFLRIKGSDEPLDNTVIHPESYRLTYRLLKKMQVKNVEDAAKICDKIDDKQIEKFAAELECGELTLRDIIQELIKPNRDPREKMAVAKLNSAITDISQLKVGMILEGTIRNIMDFGCFVDIGLHDDGLVHISELANSYVKNVSDIVKIGDIVKVKVIKVDVDLKRISLSMKRVKE
ncbi:MAG: Tex family protein [Bacilli bacterium]|nr:Tex family protein [Bacilli bacterium]